MESSKLLTVQIKPRPLKENVSYTRFGHSSKKVTYPIFIILSIVYLLFKLAENTDGETFFETLNTLIVVSGTISGLAALTELYEPQLKKTLSRWLLQTKWIHWYAKIENAFPLILVLGVVTSTISITNEQVWTSQNPNLSHWVFKHCEPSIYMFIHHFTLVVSFSSLIIYFILHKFGGFAVDISKGNSTKAIQKIRMQFLLVTALLGITSLKLSPRDIEEYSYRSRETTISMCAEVQEFRKDQPYKAPKFASFALLIPWDGDATHAQKRNLSALAFYAK